MEWYWKVRDSLEQEEDKLTQYIYERVGNTSRVEDSPIIALEVRAEVIQSLLNQELKAKQKRSAYTISWSCKVL